MTSSGVSAYNPTLSELVLESYDRIGIRASEITPDHMISARRSINLLFSKWSNLGVNLWEVDLQTVPLYQGVTTYNVPSSSIMILDAYIRTYSMGSPVNLTPAFATTINSTTVTITQANNGLSVSNYIQIVVPVSIGGIILLGYYQVTSVLSTSVYTITAADAATATTSGGVVPYFTTAAQSTAVTVTLPNHGYNAGQSFIVQISTNLGGVTLGGTYTIATIIDANNFTIASPYPAGSTASIYENSGNAQITNQNISAQPVDRIMNAISRTDYASLPNKTQQGFPTIFWFDRLINPTITLWIVPDNNGPYELRYYRVKQIEYGNPQNGQTADLPFRFLEAFCANLSFQLAMKWKPDIAMPLKEYADQVWGEAAADDRERVPLYLSPDVSSYFRD